MPFPFVLPTTSSFSFSTHFASPTHPSLPLAASTYRGVVRDALKKHKRLSVVEQLSHLSEVSSSLTNYVPYLLALDSGIGGKEVSGEEVNVVLRSTPVVEWRPTLSQYALLAREHPRLKLQSLEYEIYFILSTLAYTKILSARTLLQPLSSSTSQAPTPEARIVSITTATKQLLLASSIHDYLATRCEYIEETSQCADITKPIFRALTSLGLAEATLLAVLKDDPYPPMVAQDRNQNDREWMIKPPDIPKVRAHLFARLCLAAAEHASNALSLLSSAPGESKIDSVLLRYVEDLKRTSRAKACRFLGIDAELGGKTGEGIAWLQAGTRELGFSSKYDGKKGSSFGRLKKEWSEKTEDRKVDKSSIWGLDAGRLEESRVLEALGDKWTKMNDMVNSQPIPSTSTLVAMMPSGREIHTLSPYTPPALDSSLIERMRAPPDRIDDVDDSLSSEDEGKQQQPLSAFPGAKQDSAGRVNYY